MRRVEDAGAAIDAGRPEPPPQSGGRPVAPELVWRLRRVACLHADPAVRAAAWTALRLVRQRVDFGFRKYGRMLCTDDGRDHVNDAVAEIVDDAFYDVAAQMEGRDVGPLRAIRAAFEAAILDPGRG